MESTDSLERSLGAFSISDGDDGASNSSLESNSPAVTVEFSSRLPLPHQYWERCLDLKTGEMYYIDLRNGRKVKGDPIRRGYECLHCNNSDGIDHGEDGSDGEEEEDNAKHYEEVTEGERKEWPSLSSSSSCCSSAEDHLEEEASFLRQGNVLVVTGCKRCFMYFMLPKMAQRCPKCRSTLLLHFNGTTSLL